MPLSRFVFPWGSHTLVAFDVIHKQTLRPVAAVEPWLPAAISPRYLLTVGSLEQLWRPRANGEAASPSRWPLQGNSMDALTKAKETHLPCPWGTLASGLWGPRCIHPRSPHTVTTIPPKPRSVLQGLSLCLASCEKIRSVTSHKHLSFQRSSLLTGRWQT